MHGALIIWEYSLREWVTAQRMRMRFCEKIVRDRKSDKECEL